MEMATDQVVETVLWLLAKSTRTFRKAHTQHTHTHTHKQTNKQISMELDSPTTKQQKSTNETLYAKRDDIIASTKPPHKSHVKIASGNSFFGSFVCVCVCVLCVCLSECAC